MIPHLQLLEIITEHFPELVLAKQDMPCEIYKDFSIITDFAISLINSRDYRRLDAFLALLADLYKHSDSIMAIAFENVLVYRLGRQIEIDNDRKILTALLPGAFRQVFWKQINASAI